MGRGYLAPRLITNFAVKIRCLEEERFLPAWSVNLSETGACLRLKRPMEVNQPVVLQIRLTEQTAPMGMTGRIAWVRQDRINQAYYCGLGFTDPDPEHLMQIKDYVELGGEALLEFLSEFPLFREFSREDCQSLLKIVTLRELEKKEILYVEGTRDVDLQGLFIVQSGLLSIFKGYVPRPERQLAVVSPGQIFGETTLINDQPHSASIMAVNDSRLIQISKMGFQLMRKQQPALALDIMEVVARTLAARLGHTTKKLFSPVRF
ncbi:MAG: hypothetical protein AMJ79_08220 [Phycisphaerae bacterium SM23_30]|nr:MAG: hypothetical protein AMJ79_08220 [Phycisphaerae bacterium SM23_30]